MQISGEWYCCDDGVELPVIRGMIKEIVLRTVLAMHELDSEGPVATFFRACDLHAQSQTGRQRCHVHHGNIATVHGGGGRAHVRSFQRDLPRR